MKIVANHPNNLDKGEAQLDAICELVAKGMTEFQLCSLTAGKRAECSRLHLIALLHAEQSINLEQLFKLNLEQLRQLRADIRQGIDYISKKFMEDLKKGV